MSDKLTVLVADDSPTVNRLISYMLEKEGYRVISVSDGKTALDKALNEPLDAVLLDIMMPRLDGMQVLKKIKDEKPRLPVIILTAKNKDKDIKNALDLGANDYITKPFETAAVAEKLKQVLEEKNDH